MPEHSETDISKLSDAEKITRVVSASVKSMNDNAPHHVAGIIADTLRFVGVEAKVHATIDTDEVIYTVVTEKDGRAVAEANYKYPWGAERVESCFNLINAIDSHTFKAQISRGPGGVTLYLKDKDPSRIDKRVDGETIWDVLHWLEEKLEEREEEERKRQDVLDEQALQALAGILKKDGGPLDERGPDMVDHTAEFYEQPFTPEATVDGDKKDGGECE